MRNKCLKSVILIFAVFMTVSCSGLLTPKNSKLEKGTIRITLPETVSGARIEGSKDDVDYYLISIVSETSGTIAVSSGKYTGGTFQTKVLPGSYSVIVQGIDEDDSRYGDIKWPLFIGRTNGVTVTADKESTAQIKMKLFELHASGTTYLHARDLEYFDWGSGKLPELSYPFDGWYTDRSCTTQITEFPATDDEFFASPYLNFNNYLTYKLHDTVEIMEPGTDGSAGTDATYVLFGDFPQSKLTGQSIDFTFDKKPSYNGWYVGSDGNYYAKVENEYFLVEPVKWRVLERDYDGKGNSLLFAENVLTTGVPFYETSRDGPANSNNYEYSQIRAYLNGTSYTSSLQENYDGDDNVWLNKGFLQTAFTETAREAIITTLIDNSTENADFRCKDTNEKFFLLSFGEVTNANYGFQSASSEEDSVRSRNATAYVAALEGIDEEPSKYPYFLRSPSNYYYSERTSAVLASGKIERGPYVYDLYGVVPALCINIPNFGRMSGEYYASNTGTGDGTTPYTPMAVSDSFSKLAEFVTEHPGETPTLYLVSDVTLGGTVSCNVNIVGAGGSNQMQQVTVKGYVGNIITFDGCTCTVRNVCVDGESSRNGIDNFGNLTLENCVIQNCGTGITNNGTLTVSGGSIYSCDKGISNSGSLTVKDNCEFSSCTGNNDGRAIYQTGTDAQMTVTDCNFTGCGSDISNEYKGGSIYIDSDNSKVNRISNCSFSSYSAAGGAIYHAGSGTLTLSGCTLNDCSAVNGGGIYAAGPVSLLTTTISQCNAGGKDQNDNLVFPGRGGGIYAAANLTFDGYSKIERCQAFTDANNGSEGNLLYCTEGITVNDYELDDASWINEQTEFPEDSVEEWEWLTN